MNQPGIPARTNFDRTLSAMCESLRDLWMAIEANASKMSIVDTLDGSTSQKISLLDAILAKCSDHDKPLSLVTVSLMKDPYQMHQTQNSEVLRQFCMISVATGDATVIPVISRFITTQGRM